MKISSKQYLQALFASSQKKGNLDLIIDQLEELYKEFINLKSFLQNPQKDNQEKEKILHSWQIEPLLINFLLILNKNKDLNKLEKIIFQLKNIRNKMTNTKEITVELSQSSPEEEEKLKQSLAKKLNSKIELKIKVNPDLLGGVILKIGDQLIDNSLKNKLQQLKMQLLE